MSYEELIKKYETPFYAFDFQVFGSFTSKIVFFIVLLSLKKVFTKSEIFELSAGHSVLLILIPIGSIYVMDTVFMLAYQVQKKQVETMSLISSVILLLMNILVYYIYIKLADDLQIRKMNLVYEQQLELCDRHQKEIEISMFKIREVKHNMKNNFIAILAYAEKGDYDKIIKHVNDVMEEGRLRSSMTLTTGNIVIDSIVEYWQRTAKVKDIVFNSDLSIPMDLPFKSADLSLILGNLLENAVEAAEKSEKRKYGRLEYQALRGENAAVRNANGEFVGRFPNYHLGATSPDGTKIAPSNLDYNWLNYAFTVAATYKMTKDFGFTGDFTYITQHPKFENFAPA